MPHVTFIHGIANKPPPQDLLAIWCRTLTELHAPLSLDELGVTSSLVYWADLLYDQPDLDLAAHEGVLENTPQAIDASGGAAMPVPANPEEAAFLGSLLRKLTTLSDAEMDRAAASGSAATAGLAAAGTLERVPLPWALKKPLMAVLLRDVHHYLFDKEFGPPGRPKVPIQQTIRRRFVEVLSDPKIKGPHVVVSHSMGTVIAYDCLKRVEDCPAVDGLITIGSPLGLDEIQDKLSPGWSRDDGFPRERVRGGWRNLFDRLDPVCGFAPELGKYFRRAGEAAVVDQAVMNTGAWRHSATKYLRQPAFASALRELLGL